MPSLKDKLSKRATQRKAAPHIIVNALAGTGKTTTLIEGLKKMLGFDVRIKPSPQQAAVWKALETSKDASSVCFVAFNKSIAVELQQRIPPGCTAMTMHSLGNSAVTRAFGRCKLDDAKTDDIVAGLLGMDLRQLYRTKFATMSGCARLVELCKVNLTGFFEDGLIAEDNPLWDELLEDLVNHYDLDVNGSRTEIFSLVPQVLHKSMDIAKSKAIDFADMIWLPVVLDLPMTKHGLLLVDECQDLGKCQQALAMKAGDRLVLVGDVNQAIYGFAGADAYSMANLQAKLEASDRGCLVLPLTVTRRCGHAIVKEAQKLVPAFEAHEDNPVGSVTHMKLSEYLKTVGDQDMVLCRVNAPLVSQCFRLIKAGKRANIQGRDIGKGLVSTIRKLKAENVVDLIAKIDDWRAYEEKKELAKRKPSEMKLININDKADCIICLCEGLQDVDGVIRRIEDLFTDDRDQTGILLSSCHKSKGLESGRVFLLQLKGASVPHPMAKSAWQREQEMNLLYVAITRSIDDLVYVTNDDREDQPEV